MSPREVPFTLLWTHAAYWVLAALVVWFVRRLRLQVERVARKLEEESSR
jgi:hypothetical protein